MHSKEITREKSLLIYISQNSESNEPRHFQVNSLIGAEPPFFRGSEEEEGEGA